MIEVLRTDSHIRLDYAAFLLEQAGCHPFVADRYTGVSEGSMLRILVPDEFAALAEKTLLQLDAPSAHAESDSGEEDSGEEDE